MGIRTRLRSYLATELDLAATQPPPAPLPHERFPALQREHIAGAAFFAGRYDLIASLTDAHRGTIAEVGIGGGRFSEFLLQTLDPSHFVAIDLFRAHEADVVRGRPAAEAFDGLTHRQFYERRLAKELHRMTINEGPSWEMLAAWPDEHFDMIYIDAAHDYESVKKDAEVAGRKVKRDGILVFNDYIIWPGQHDEPYGVVQAVNDLVVHGDGWHVIAFALARRLFCDIAIRRVARDG